MNAIIHEREGLRVAQIADPGVIIENGGDFLDIVANSGSRHLVVSKENLSPDFFDLKTGLAGEILQKASNYGVSFAILGDFKDSTSKSLRDFIYESNRTGKHLFVETLSEALDRFARG